LLALALAVLGLAALAPDAQARAGREADSGPRARLTAAFRPKRLGAPTTVAFTVDIDGSKQQVPTPISRIEVGYPEDLGLATSGLGLAACEPALLEDEAACPANSKMGQGTALVEVPFGPEVVPETVALGFYAAPSNDGRLHLAIVVHGTKPVLATLVMSGVLLPGRLQITVPRIIGVAGGPDVSLVRMSASIGGALTYFEQIGGRSIPYRPRGIGLPDRCPHGGWQLAASFAFIDGARSTAETVIPCPTSSVRRNSTRG
jgi:hypothetical protein